MDEHQQVVIAGQNPFNKNGLSASVNQGAVAIEQERAIAEAQGQIIVAKRFPRSNVAVMAEFLESCKSPEFAAKAFYTVPNRGSGPSIRFAEELARCMGNFQFGHRELSRTAGKSEIEVFAWDVEKNSRSTRQITVEHIQDSKGGPKRLTDQADIDNKIANVAAKQMRGRIMALMPKHIIESGILACQRTIAGGNGEPLAKRLERMIAAFGRFGVQVAHLEAYLKHKLDLTTDEEMAELMGVFNALKDGTQKASDFFTAEKEPAPAAEAIKSLAESQTKAPANQVKAENKLAPASKSQSGKKPQVEKAANTDQKVAESANSLVPPPTETAQDLPIADEASEDNGKDEVF